VEEFKGAARLAGKVLVVMASAEKAAAAEARITANRTKDGGMVLIKFRFLKCPARTKWWSLLIEGKIAVVVN
jgi:hypothetical protein